MIQKSHEDHVSRAIAWLLLGVIGGLLLDLCAKEILRTYSLQQFVLVRSLIALAILLALAPRLGGLRSLRTGEKGWHLLRTILGMGAMFGFFYGLSVMPLVNALTLGYTAPLIMTALSAIFLGDRVGWILFLGAGVCSVLAWIGLVNGYRAASPALLAPFEYLALVGGAIAGFLIWDEVPDVWVVVGALIIVASGLFVVYREVAISMPE